MNPERWQQVRQIFQGALELQGQERGSFLERACTSDSELRREVESLLLHHQQAGTTFLKTPVLDLSAAAASRVSREGRRIGVYQIIEPLGRGGMGEVYRAARADGLYEKEVALKLVRSGFDTDSILARFRNERQILATLDHPNIARLLDGGTTDEGVPYLVMELVAGAPIDEYCEAHALPITERLQLFRQVCAAVQYAHQRLVIHRDIKPTNILVTREGMPKLLDFGIAKILDAAAGSETTIARPMTPQYASPEQIRGETITTASDVYSLGVLLYRLLTSLSPYGPETRTAHELARIVTEVQPTWPSSAVANAAASASGVLPGNSPARLRRRLAGDLDNIVLKALRKEPERRYASVEQFGEDVRRHLERLPVIARRDSWSYRAGKFIRRHRVGMAATALVLLALIGGVAATVREARVARAERARAEKRFNDVRRLANSLMFEIHDSIRDLPGSIPARKLLVTRALEYLDRLNQEAKGDVSLQKELAAAYERVGDVLGYPYAANLGDKAGALESYRKALAIRESLAAAGSNDTQLQRDLVGNYFRVADVLESAGNFPEALAAVRKAMAITQRISAGSHDPSQADQLAGSYYFTANLQVESGDPTAALENYQRAAAIREAALQANQQNLQLRTHLAADYAGVAKCLEQKGDLLRATPMQARAVAILEDTSKANPTNAVFREYLGEATNRFGSYRKEQGDATAALRAFRAAHEIFRTLRVADSKDSLAKSNFGFTDNGIAESLVTLGKPAAALAVFQEAVATFEDMAPATSGNRYIRSGLADSYAGLGKAYSALATVENTSENRRLEYWRKARSSCATSLGLWQDKTQRGELESSERDEARRLSQCVAQCDSHLHPATASKADPH